MFGSFRTIFESIQSSVSIALELLAVMLVATVFLSWLDNLHADDYEYHNVRGRMARGTTQGRFEGEHVAAVGSNARVQGMGGFGNQWSGNSHLLWHDDIGRSVTLELETARKGQYQLSVQLTAAPDYGIFDILINGKVVTRQVDLFSTRVELAKKLDLGKFEFSAGKQKIEFRLTGGNRNAKKYRGVYLLGVDYIDLKDLNPVADLTPRSKRWIAPPVSLGNAPGVTSSLVREQLDSLCIDCHGETDPEAGIVLSSLNLNAGEINGQLANQIALELQRKAMPPAEVDQPSKSQREKLVSFFRFAATAAALKSPPPSAVMRRLNRFEYNNAVRDLLKLKGDVFPLPEKVIRPSAAYFDPASGSFPNTVVVGNRTLGKNQVEKQILTGVSPFAIDLQAEHGFNNRGEQLGMSPLLFESLLQLSKSIVFSPEFDSYCQRKELFADPGQLHHSQSLAIARERLEPFVMEAFRSNDQRTLNRFVQFFDSELKRTGDFNNAMKKVVTAILASPRFLYLTELPKSPSEKLSDFELAARLALFLWSSIPDAELLSHAKAGTLNDKEVFQRQVDRMLEDPRCQALSQNFARQWLRLDQLITAVPDFERFERYYSRIGCEQWKFGLQMMIEPLLLFERIMVEDRSVMLLIDSRFSHRSDELESWYHDAIPFAGKQNRNRFNTNQQAFRSRELKSKKEGGVITSAAVLTMTSGPLRTQPITRGAWVASTIFNQPPDPPPDEIPTIESDDAAIEAEGVTLRQRLEQHRKKASCAACHAKIDPFGFALENYDPVGRWRDDYRSGLPIDASGRLFGEFQFKNAIELKEQILEHPEWFLRAFSAHLLSYAIGRELVAADEPDVTRIVQAALRDRGRFSTIIHHIVTSRSFQAVTISRD